MRKFFRAAVVVACCAAMVTAGATASLAAPAPTGITWDTYGGTVLKPWSGTSVCSTGAAFQPEQTVLVQVLRNGSWADVRFYDSAAVQGQWCLYASTKQLASRPGRYTFRALTRVSPAAPLSEAQTTLTLTTDAGYASPAAVPEFSTTSAKKAVPVDVGTADGQRVDLQRKSGSRWLNVSSAVTPRTGTQASVRLTIPAKSGTSNYRVVNRATTWTTTYVGDPFTIHQTDAARHRAYIVKARKFIAAYCPKTPIYIDTPAVAGRGFYGTVGRATGSWSTGGSSGSLSTYIQLRSGLPAAQLRSVALHECAHVLQYRSAVEGRYETEQASADRLWPGTGFEGQADCMSFHLTKDKRYFGYVRGCSKAQSVDAKRMWRAYGEKYQAAEFRWGS